jgi:hypothetical protein
MSDVELAKYVTRGGVQTFAPPILAKGTRMTSLALQADPAALQRIVDQFLNGPAAAQTDQRFHALGNLVFLAYAPMDHISVTDPIDRNKGFMRETDVAIWMPLVGGKMVAGTFAPTAVYWFMPNVWVDVPTAMTTGRELYGFPKEMAWVQGSGAGKDRRIFALSTMVLPRYTAATELLEKPLFSVERSSDPEPGLEKAWTEAKDAFDAVVGFLHAERGQIEATSIGFWLDLSEHLLRAEVPMIFLKEFRDVSEPHRACYQRVVTAPCVVKGFRGGYPLLAEYTVTLFDYASHPIAKDFGFGTPTDGKLTLSSKFGFYVDFDFELGLGSSV